MKRVVLFLVVLVFSLNTLSASALAGHCPSGGDTITMKMKELAAAAAETDAGPCPMHAQTQPTPAPVKQEPCKGLCLCMHLLHTQNILMPANMIMPVMAEQDSIWQADNYISVSLTFAPPRRPPKYIS